MDPRGPRVDRGDRVRDRQVAVAVPVPVDAGARPAVGRHARDEAYDRRGAGRGRVTDRVGNAEAGGAHANRGRVQHPQRVWICPRRVFRHVHHRQSLTHRELNGFLGPTLEIVEGPAFRVLADRARADEGAALDR